MSHELWPPAGRGGAEYRRLVQHAPGAFARGWFVGDYGMDTDGEDFLPFRVQPFEADPANVFVRRLGLVP